MKDFKGNDIEIGDRIVLFREKSLVEGIVIGETATKKNVRYEIVAHKQAHRVGQVEASQFPHKTMMIEKGAGLVAISPELAASAADQLKELL